MVSCWTRRWPTRTPEVLPVMVLVPQFRRWMRHEERASFLFDALCTSRFLACNFHLDVVWLPLNFLTTWVYIRCNDLRWLFILFSPSFCNLNIIHGLGCFKSYDCDSHYRWWPSAAAAPCRPIYEHNWSLLPSTPRKTQCVYLGFFGRLARFDMLHGPWPTLTPWLVTIVPTLKFRYLSHFLTMLPS